MLHFHVVFFTLHYCRSSEDTSWRKCFSFSHIPNPLHDGLLLCKSSLCKALILLQDSDLFTLSTPPLIWYLASASYPLSTLTSLSLEISLEQRNCAPSTAGHLAEVDPVEQNPSILSLIASQHSFRQLQTHTGAPSAIASSLPCSLRPVPPSPGKQDPWKVHPTNL